MVYTPYGPFANASASPPINAAFLNAVETELVGLGTTAAAVGAGKALAGTGIDPTGGTVSTTAVQTFLDNCVDGDTVVIPNHAIINLDNTVTVTKRLTFTGSGELRWTAGIANKPLLDVTADGCLFLGLYITNPGYLAAQTGNRTSGIHFQANSGRVIGCRIIGQQQAINVEANGEWHDFVFQGNIILDVPGSGDGPSNTTSGNGEDRGDGIVVWGATATITGNRVAALNGTDARIGIHVEALGSFETTAYAYADSHCIIANNIVTGKFRRGITNEGLTHVTITGNTVADSTWYAINLVGSAHRSVIANNTIQWTRTTSDNQGGAFGPDRSGISIYGSTTNAVVSKNNIYVVTGAAMPYGVSMYVQNVSGTLYIPARILVEGNMIEAADSNISRAFELPVGGASQITIRGNFAKGFVDAGVYARGVNDMRVIDNELLGQNATYGVYIFSATGTNSSAVVDQNIVQTCATALYVGQRTAYQSVSENRIYSASVGIDMTGSASPTQVSNNLFALTTTKTQNLPSGVTSFGNN